MVVDKTVPTLQVVKIVSDNAAKATIAGYNSPSPTVDLPISNTGEPWNTATNVATTDNTVTLVIQASEGNLTSTSRCSTSSSRM